jgi:hypothetical protein
MAKRVLLAIVAALGIAIGASAPQTYVQVRSTAVPAVSVDRAAQSANESAGHVDSCPDVCWTGPGNS